MSKSLKIGIIGAGGWGTALSKLLAANGHQVALWSYEREVVEEINTYHTNSIFLPGVVIPDNIIATPDSYPLNDSEIFLIAVPTQHIRDVLANYHFDFAGKLVVNIAKGIENNTMMRVSEILYDSSKLKAEQYILITGPSHAEEVAREMPTTVVAASENYSAAKQVQEIFLTHYFRVYTSDDVIGCEIGGALKNVIAIAAGIIDGLCLGDNTKAALITRGLAEISRLGIALGANPLTFSGLSGLGDLYVTCSSQLSRNRFVGEQIGKGKSVAQITSEMLMVAEGIYTTQSAYSLAQKHDVDLPIIEQMYKILFDGLQPLAAIKELMTRQSKREWWW